MKRRRRNGGAASPTPSRVRDGVSGVAQIVSDGWQRLAAAERAGRRVGAVFKRPTYAIHEGE